MFKVAWLLKRKRGMSHADFQARFERTHAPMAQKYIGHLLIAYRRNYLHQVQIAREPRDVSGGYDISEWEWDLLSEWVMPDEAAFQEAMRILAVPHISKAFRGDSARFSEQAATVLVRCTVVDTPMAG